MRVYFVLLATLLLFGNSSKAQWQSDFNVAKQKAVSEHKYILLNFSGSDWCGPCIRLHKEIFNHTSFVAFSKDSLIMVNADFPRQKKNQLSKIQQQQNDALADKYNAAGSFPFTLLLTADGKVVKAWDGFYKNGVDEFIYEIKEAIHGTN